MVKEISVVKRDGTKAKLDISKIQRQVQNACDGIDGVSPSLIELRAHIQFYDGVKTQDIDSMLLRSMVSLIDEEENPTEGNVNYQYVAGKQRLSMLRKEVYGSYTPNRLFDIVRKNVEAGVYTTELLEWYSEEEWDTIELFVDHSRDESMSFAAIEQLVDKYLVRNRVTGLIYETPQIRYVIAAATAFHSEAKKSRIKFVKEFYDAASKLQFTLATPVLAGLGTPTKQFSSCVTISAGDSINSIFASGEMMARYAAKRAGIGFEIGSLRGIGAPIRGGELKHTGMIPFLKKWFGDLRSVSQGGIRNASCSVNYPIWHWQFDDLIVLKNNQGTDETRIRQMDYVVQMTKLFWCRYVDGGNITLFDPAEVPELADYFYSDHKKFEEEYVRCESRTDIRKKVLPADEVITSLIKERTDTGRIYLMFMDNVQDATPYIAAKSPIRMTNLCCEINIPTVPFERVDDPDGRIGLCTLGSLNLGAFKNPSDMEKPAKILVRALSNLLQYQEFLSIQSERHNKEYEPLGVGITNLAYWMTKRKLKYGTDESLAEVKRWMEHMHYYLYDASSDLAIERGACEKFDHTYFSQGIFTWERRAEAVNELTDFTPELNWGVLREKIIKYGMRNTVLSAIAPCESSSLPLNSTNGMEMPMSLISTKESKGGSIIFVVPEYQKLKKQYQLLWDQKDCVDYLKTAAVIAAYVDQSLSTNTFYNPAFFDGKRIPQTLIIKNIMLAHRWGIRTLYYSLMNKLGTKEVVLNQSQISEEQLPEDDCEACKL